MPITVELIKEGRVVLQTYSDPLEIAHITALKDRMDNEILPGASAKLHIIADFRQTHRLPATVLSRGAAMMNNAHPNTGMVVAVIQNPFVYRMARAFASLTPRRSFQVTQTFDDAVKIINDALARETSSTD